MSSRVFGACAPKEEDFDSYEDYLHALGCYEQAIAIAEMSLEDRDE